MKNLDKRAVASTSLNKVTPYGARSEEQLPLLPGVETTTFCTNGCEDGSAIVLLSGIGHSGRDRTSSLTSEGSSQRSKDNDSGNSSLVDSGSSDSCCHEFRGSRSRTISSSKSDQNLTHWRFKECSGSLEEALTLRRLKAAFLESELCDARTFNRRRGRVLSEDGSSYFTLFDSTSQSCKHIYHSSDAFDNSSPTYSELRQKEWERTKLFYKKARPAGSPMARSLSTGNIFSQTDSEDALSLEPGRPGTNGHSRCGSFNTGSSGSSRCSTVSSSYKGASFIDPNLHAHGSNGSLAWNRSDDSLASLSCRCHFNKENAHLNDTVAFSKTFTDAYPGFCVANRPTDIQPTANPHLPKKSHVPKLKSVLCYGTPLAYSSLKFNDGSSQTRECQPPLQVFVPRLCPSYCLPQPSSQIIINSSSSSSTATCQSGSHSVNPILSEIPPSTDSPFSESETSSSSIYHDSPNGTQLSLFSHDSENDRRIEFVPNQNPFIQFAQENFDQFDSAGQNVQLTDIAPRHPSTNAFAGFETRGDNGVERCGSNESRNSCYQKADSNPCGMTTVDMSVCRDTVQQPGLTPANGQTAGGHPGGMQRLPQGDYTMSNSVANSNQSLTNSLQSGHGGGRRRSLRHSSLTELLKHGRKKVSHSRMGWSREIPDYRLLCLVAAIFNPVFGAVAFLLNYFAGQNFQLHRLNRANNLYLATIITNTSGIFITLIGLALLAAHSVAVNSHPAAAQNSSQFLCHATDDLYIRFFGLSRSTYCDLKDNYVVMEAFKHYYLMDLHHRRKQAHLDKQNASLALAQEGSDQRPNGPAAPNLPYLPRVFYQNYSGGGGGEEDADGLMYHNTVKGSIDEPVIPPGLEKEMEIQKRQQSRVPSASVSTPESSTAPNTTQSVNA
ncbi:hypothetical protein Btru_022244 [Bulinus truncatus]|nr:hypothetical protein Btru_022244 [Bulinus truncatus]